VECRKRFSAISIVRIVVLDLFRGLCITETAITLARRNVGVESYVHCLMRQRLALDSLLVDRIQLLQFFLYKDHLRIASCVVEEVELAGNDTYRLQFALHVFWDAPLAVLP